MHEQASIDAAIGKTSLEHGYLVGITESDTQTSKLIKGHLEIIELSPEVLRIQKLSVSDSRLEHVDGFLVGGCQSELLIRTYNARRKTFAFKYGCHWPAFAVLVVLSGNAVVRHQ
jgi:hypothetical protein